MEFIIRIEARLAGKVLNTHDVATITRAAAGLGPEELGLTLEQGKQIARQVQTSICQTGDLSI